MINYKIDNDPIQVKEYQALRQTTGWNMLSNEAVANALKHDLFSVKVHHDDKLIGMGRVIGDGGIYFYIQDVIVHPDYQKLGIGRVIMFEIDEYIEKNAPKHAFVGLMAAKGLTGYYNQFNFKKRDEDAPGMYRVIGKE